MSEDDVGRELVVFVSGLWFHSSCWQLWLAEFDASGYDCARFQWPWERVAAMTEVQSSVGSAPVTMRDLVAELTCRLRQLGRPPILIGHGLGGLLADIMLTRGMARAAISLAPVPVGRALLSGIPVPRGGRKAVYRLLSSRHDRPTLEQWVRTFANASDADEAARLYQDIVTNARARSLVLSAVVPTSLGGLKLATGARPRGPLLLAGGGHDLLIHEATLGVSHRRSRRHFPESVTDLKVFPDRDHCLNVDGGWRSIAFYCLDWLTDQDL